MGDVKQAESVPPVQKKAAAPKEQKPKDAKKEAKKEAKKAAPKPEPVEKAEEEEEAPKPKPKNALDLLPPSKMILDEWKKLYSTPRPTSGRLP
jgi:elongation factor 1-gamma